MTRKVFLVLMALCIVALVLAACTEEAEETLEAVAPTIEAAVEDVAPTIEAAVEEVAPTLEAAVEEVAPTVEAAVEEVTEEMGACTPAEDGPLAGVDPRGQTVVWWYNHGSREEKLLPLLAEFNETKECSIT